MAIQNFKRYECKYQLTELSYRRILKEIPKHMETDRYCKDGKDYSIYNIYFDTRDNAIIRTCLQKPYYKEKLRLRSYKIPSTMDDTVFLELKKKIGGIVAKRRAQMTYGQALAFVAGGKTPELEPYENRQVCLEISDFLSRCSVRPMSVISYERTAFFGKDDREFRVSFDHSIRSRRESLDLREGGGGELLLPKGSVLMEVKCLGALPLWLCYLLTELNIHRTHFSKYGTDYKNHVNSPQAVLTDVA